MRDNVKIEAAVRESVGTGSAREARRAGMLPVSIYGGKEKPVAATISPKAIFHEIQTLRFFTHVYELNFGGKIQRVIPRDVQRHPVTDVPLHIDFMRVSGSDSIHVHIPVHLINEDKCEGLKRGGVLNTILHEIEVVCPVGSIPESLEADLAGVSLGHSLHTDALVLPKGVKIAHPERDNTLATIVVPSSVKAETEAAAEAEEDATDA
ncbi:MAG: 50S ribosomal protein L25/general stress protein Ctc [Alphaproteobacteria bacterium]|nr:MAG: 50S ribosomal protein L25/general stress protein Ctc [Alphaproteobacteria bacterium]